MSRIELARLDKNTAELDDIIAHMGNPLQEVIEVSTFYNAVGAYDEAVELLDYVIGNCPEYASTPMQKEAVEPFTKSPLLNYMAGYYVHKSGDAEKALEYYKKAALMSTESHSIRQIINDTIIWAISYITTNRRTRLSTFGNAQWSYVRILVSHTAISDVQQTIT